MAKIYKEGQGKWARGIMVVVILVSAVLALFQLHDALPRGNPVNLPLIGFDLDYRFFIHGPLLVAAAYLAYRLFNRPRTADFLIETESELKTKVTWPSRKEEVSSSIVVVVTVIVLGVVIFTLDMFFGWLNRSWYG